MIGESTEREREREREKGFHNSFKTWWPWSPDQPFVVMVVRLSLFLMFSRTKATWLNSNASLQG